MPARQTASAETQPRNSGRAGPAMNHSQQQRLRHRTSCRTTPLVDESLEVGPLAPAQPVRGGGFFNAKQDRHVGRPSPRKGSSDASSVLHRVSDLATAKAVYAALLGPRRRCGGDRDGRASRRNQTNLGGRVFRVADRSIGVRRRELAAVASPAGHHGKCEAPAAAVTSCVRSRSRDTRVVAWRCVAAAGDRAGGESTTTSEESAEAVSV